MNRAKAPVEVVQSPIFREINGVPAPNRMCVLFPFGILGILATRYAGTTIARLGQATRVDKCLPVDTRAEFIGRQPGSGEVLQTLRHRPGSAAARRTRPHIDQPPCLGGPGSVDHAQATAGHGHLARGDRANTPLLATLIGSECLFPTDI